MDSGTVVTVIAEVQVVGDEILETLAGFAPGVAVPAEVAETVLNLLAKYVTKSITAFSAASGTPITAESIMALLPNADPLTPPPE